jgi:hypothetical protein
MGCDIHMIVERNVGAEWIPLRTKTEYTNYVKPEDPYYYGYFNWESGRNYTLFEQLAQVRVHYGDLPTLGDPRGLPEDPSEITQLASDQWGIDGHSHSWFTLRELLEFKGWHEHCWDFERFVKNKLTKLGPPDGVRIVFWFDN